MTHTPTPWQRIIDDTGGQYSGWPSIVPPEEVDLTVIHRAGFHHEFWDGHPGLPETLANADRIVACVNAFHGREIATEKITEGLFWEMQLALELVLPMAKGYAAQHRVGSNAEYIETARALLAKMEE